MNSSFKIEKNKDLNSNWEGPHTFSFNGVSNRKHFKSLILDKIR